MEERYMTLTQIIEKNGYMGILAQDGWETLELTVLSDYGKNFGSLLIGQIE